VHQTKSHRSFFFISILLGLQAATAALASSPNELPQGDDLQRQVHDRMAAGQFSGAVLVAHDGAPLFELANGEADREAHQPNTANTKFRFGSMGKMFTGVAVAQLVQAGKVRFDDPLSRYLPDYPNKDVARVTIEQLLTHTAGTGDIFGPEFAAHRDELKELKDYVSLYSSRGLMFAPGSRHEYSNYGYILLGRVIEIASGESYYDYVRKNIFVPAGMHDTDNEPESSHIANLAVAYTNPDQRHGPGPGPGRGPGPGVGTGTGPGRPEAGGRAPSIPSASLVRADQMLPYRGTSAGGGYSTVNDLLKFANALIGNKLVNSQLTNLLTTGKVDTPRPGLKYGLGFEDATSPDGIRRIGHGGGAPGMNGVLWIFPESHHTIVVLANLDPPIAQDLARDIAEQLPLH
jgi:D-alanyl-D-alanine carboxypeptidase